jgi:lipoprotein-releasing system permease protein
MKISVNTEIALIYLVSRRKQSIVASLGVTFGICMFIFMNSLISGTNNYFEKVTLSATPHIRVYNDNKLSDSKMLDGYLHDGSIKLISNPQLEYSDNHIYNADAIITALRKNGEVVAISPQVSTNVTYSNGNVQKNGNVAGMNILEQDKMFDITSTMIAGAVADLNATPDGIILGVGLAKSLSVGKGGNVTLVGINGAAKQLRVVGIFKTTIKNIDNNKSYTNIPVVQQLLRKDRNYITDVYVNIANYTRANAEKKHFEHITGYNVETWQDANEQSIAARMIRDIIANSVVITILIVAGFGIYNILNMVIYEKIKEIAILKATGFQGRHVINIFIKQALMIGVIGATLGLLTGWAISYLVSRMYLGIGNVDYLPMDFAIKHYIRGGLFGIVTAFFAGYIPAIKASKVDPVQIIRG